jgi:dipeptidyl aminopeptidase/acylaminoacyl peptidase
MNVRPRRWWLVPALGRSRVVRAVDRVEALVVVASLALVLFAALYCSSLADAFYTSRSHTVAAEAATHHRIDATATAASTAEPKTVQQAIQRYTVHVRWLAQNVTREKDLTLDHAVKAGDHVPVWLDDRGNATAPPLTDADAHGDAVGAAALLWVVATSVIAASVFVLRRLLNGVRYRSWDRALQWLLVDNGGGPSARSH